MRELQVGFIFQHYAPFRHMSVFDNVAFGLRVKPSEPRPAEPYTQRRVRELLELVRLDWLADRLPSELSGGQRQRIARPRALAVEPKVLLLDEPFGALDAKVRKELRSWRRRLQDELHITSVFVTHGQEEALEVADCIVLMTHGRVVQIGSPQEVVEQPGTGFVADFLNLDDHGPTWLVKAKIRHRGLDIRAAEKKCMEPRMNFQQLRTCAKPCAAASI